MKSGFSSRLIRWNREKNTREMPWKGEKDPYRIWLSEVILQQTRVEQGLGYYQRFIAHFPTIEKLAAANDETVIKLWEGLGYYNRCRNLLETARSIVSERNGRFPDRYDEIRQLKGVGPYIAAAIASFAYNLPYAVLDGNVFRVLSRVYGVETPLDSAAGRKEFRSLADDNLDRRCPGIYNQAIMDFGATVCKPVAPLCETCPMKAFCVAKQKDSVNRLPVKERKPGKKHRWFYYFLFHAGDKVLVQQRQKKDIWQGLHELYLLESEGEMDWNKTRLSSWLREQIGVHTFSLDYVSDITEQQLTHQKIYGQFLSVRLPGIPESLQRYRWVSIAEMNRLAFPKLINRHLGRS